MQAFEFAAMPRRLKPPVVKRVVVLSIPGLNGYIYCWAKIQRNAYVNGVSQQFINSTQIVVTRPPSPFPLEIVPYSQDYVTALQRQISYVYFASEIP